LIREEALAPHVGAAQHMQPQVMALSKWGAWPRLASHSLTF
jgi:hypothetical protein